MNLREVRAMVMEGIRDTYKAEYYRMGFTSPVDEPRCWMKRMCRDGSLQWVGMPTEIPYGLRIFDIADARWTVHRMKLEEHVRMMLWPSYPHHI